MKLPRRERGVTLIFVMLFLVLIALMSLSAFRASTVNMRATQNTMVRQEALSAAQWAIEDTISNGAFETTPAPAAITKDVTGDGGSNYTATLVVPNCKKIRYLMVKELPRDATTGFPKDEWRTCDTGQSGKAGGGGPGFIEITGATSAPSTVASYCAEALWNIQATVLDTRSNSQVTLNQGVAVPHPIDKIDTVCNRL